VPSDCCHHADPDPSEDLAEGKAGFKHRLWAQTARFAQLHLQVQYLEVVVVVPHRRLRLGPDRLPRQLVVFLAGVHWLSLLTLPGLSDDTGELVG